MKEIETYASQDRLLRSKMTDDSAQVARENATLSQRILELKSRLDRACTILTLLNKKMSFATWNRISLDFLMLFCCLSFFRPLSICLTYLLNSHKCIPVHIIVLFPFYQPSAFVYLSEFLFVSFSVFVFSSLLSVNFLSVNGPYLYPY